MLSTFTALSLGFGSLLVVRAQQVGNSTPEVHPPITFQTCTTSGGCKTQNGAIVLDANYRWLHTASGQTCNPAGFNKTLCPDATTCAANCALDGVDYNSTGITTSGNSLNLLFGNGGSRVYLLNSAGEYENFHVLNQEFTFDVNVSNVPCAFNGALYFSEMTPDGGLSALNKAGAAYGTGYCDSQCSGGTNFFNGTVNFDGSLGACCNEMDLWEANNVDTQLTPHPCNVTTGDFACTGSQCSTFCDPDGCDFNPFRMGNQTFYGPGASNTIDTTKPFTVVTQFITNDNTPTGTLVEIKRFYVQNNTVVPNSVVNLPGTGLAATNSITEAFCDAKVQDLGDVTLFQQHGGLAQMGQSLARGAVLVISLWNDLTAGMSWLDGLEGTDPTAPGALRGPCAPGPYEADPAASVTFSNIKVGDINSTFVQPAPTKPSPPSPTQTRWGQCGGMYYSGPTSCASSSTCTYSNPYYSQCL